MISNKDDMNAEDAFKKAQKISVSRILTDEDFKYIQNKVAIGQVSENFKGKKRKLNIISTDDCNKNEIVELTQIEFVHKKMRHDKEGRLATVCAGREGRRAYNI